MTQTQSLKLLFQQRQNEWIPLYEIMKHSAQYNARIYELRAEGLNIINKTEVVGGQRHSWYKLDAVRYVNGQMVMTGV